MTKMTNKIRFRVIMENEPGEPVNFMFGFDDKKRGFGVIEEAPTAQLLKEQLGNVLPILAERFGERYQEFFDVTMKMVDAAESARLGRFEALKDLVR